LEEIDLRSLPNDFSFNSEILFRLDNIGARMKEIPIEFHSRRSGRSKYKFIDLAGNLKILIKVLLGKLLKHSGDESGRS
jgi:hypothetical protein